MSEKSIAQKMVEWLYVVHYSTLDILAAAAGCSESVAKTTLYRLVKRGLVKSFKRQELGHKLLFILTLDGVELAIANPDLKIWDYSTRQSAVSGRMIKHHQGVQFSILDALKNLTGEFDVDMNRCDAASSAKLFDALLHSRDGTGIVFGIEYERTPKSGHTLRDFFERIAISYREGRVHVILVVSRSQKVLERYRSELLKLASSYTTEMEYKQMSLQKNLSAQEILDLVEIFCFQRLELK